MSSTLSPVNLTEVQADKPVTEKPEIEQKTNQSETLNSNDTNLSTQNEISPLKRDSNEITGDDEKTPARTKKTRVDRFQEESKALLKSFGLEDGPGSEKRLTRSRTRGTPVSTPISKTEPVKQTTGAKRGRKPQIEKKEQVATENDDQAVKATPKKGRGRPKQSAVMDNGENNRNTEELLAKVDTLAGQEQKQTEDNNEVVSTGENKTNAPEIVSTKEEITNTLDNAISTESSPKSHGTLDSPVIQKEEVKVPLPKNLNENKSDESSKETNSEEKSNDTNDTSKVENNLTNNSNKQSINEQVNKNEPVDQLTKTVVEKPTEKVVESSKLSPESVEKQEVQTTA